MNLTRNCWKTLQYSTQFVPKHHPVSPSDVQQLQRFIDASNKLVVVTGAGISTESGIPDYRSEAVGLYARSNHKPIENHRFLNSALVRKRFWARNFVGWTRFSTCQPNLIHETLAKSKRVSWIITQNVDGLHRKISGGNLVELHGSAFNVRCLDCNKNYHRSVIQNLLQGLNPNFLQVSEMIRPDGDVEIPPEIIEGFQEVFCGNCHGNLKPDIVFFGDNVPKARVDLVRNIVRDADALLVLGSSLSVFSGFRIVLQAVEEEKPVAIVNIGATRGDKLAQLKIDAKCGDVLEKVLM